MFATTSIRVITRRSGAIRAEEANRLTALLRSETATGPQTPASLSTGRTSLDNPVLDEAGDLILPGEATEPGTVFDDATPVGERLPTAPPIGLPVDPDQVAPLVESSLSDLIRFEVTSSKALSAIATSVLFGVIAVTLLVTGRFDFGIVDLLQDSTDGWGLIVIFPTPTAASTASSQRSCTQSF